MTDLFLNDAHCKVGLLGWLSGDSAWHNITLPPSGDCREVQQFVSPQDVIFFLSRFLSGRSVGYGGPHDVHHSLPADCQPGPRGLETSNVGLQLVVHVSSLTAFDNLQISVAPANCRMLCFY